MYYFFLDGTRLPVPPSRMTISTRGNNRVVNLIDEGDINILKLPQLKEISMDVLLPQGDYPFRWGNHSPYFYLQKFERWKEYKEKIRFIVVRMSPKGKMLWNTNVEISLEDYTIKEDANHGMDITVSLKLKEYKSYGTKGVETVTRGTKTTYSIVKSRRGKSAPLAPTYKVKLGDCLWNIVKRYCGSSTSWADIWAINKDIIKNPSDIIADIILKLK